MFPPRVLNPRDPDPNRTMERIVGFFDAPIATPAVTREAISGGHRFTVQVEDRVRKPWPAPFMLVFVGGTSLSASTGTVRASFTNAWLVQTNDLGVAVVDVAAGGGVSCWVGAMPIILSKISPP